MKVQQYSLRIGDVDDSTDFTEADYGQFVHRDNDSGTVMGFISDTDSSTFITITLFEPIEHTELPAFISDTSSYIECWATLLMIILDTKASDAMRQEWASLMSPTSE